MNITVDEDIQARQSTTCPGCGEPKAIGLKVCWPCFKYRPLPYKYFQGNFVDWIEAKNVEKPMTQSTKHPAEGPQN